jgi:hypothetical protein
MKRGNCNKTEMKKVLISSAIRDSQLNQLNNFNLQSH